MNISGSYCVRYALEQIGVKYTFGIPGVHNTEIYDEINKSETITPILVTHEGCASFMADSITRTGNSIGVCLVVPGAGLTHAASGIAEAYLDGIAMLVITGGTRRDTGREYQLHQIDQEKMTHGFSKGYFRPNTHDEITQTIYDAYELAVSGEPGPVIIEIPGELQLLQGKVSSLPNYSPSPKRDKPILDRTLIEKACDLLMSHNYGIYVGWGAVKAFKELEELAELLEAPVCTTLQGLSSFRASHPLHTGMGFGRSAVPAAENTFKNIEGLLAIGVRFSELATGSYGIDDPQNLIHIDINKNVFDKNYQTTVAIHADALEAIKAIIETLKQKKYQRSHDQTLRDQIKNDKLKYNYQWIKELNENKVGPGFFFKALRDQLSDDDIVVADDGNHTFLTEELMPINSPVGFISPSDFNCMGYCVPATIAAKLNNPNKEVVGIVGDGAFMMTCMEIITASNLGLTPIFFIFNDGELGQISMFQKIPLNRKTCTVLPSLNFEGVAKTTGAQYFEIHNDNEIEAKFKEIFSPKRTSPTVVNVKIDYSKKTKFTEGVVKTNLGRFPLRDKVRILGRALKRHIVG
jgi:acetolactate synthase-1/2/3 large subunit